MNIVDVTALSPKSPSDAAQEPEPDGRPHRAVNPPIATDAETRRTERRDGSERIRRVRLKKVVLRGLLHAARAAGLFRVARHLTRRQLRIITFHGISMHDEHLFRGGLFMSRDTFRARMNLLSRKRYPVVGLADALRSLNSDTLPPAATVITIDDGWFGVAEFMAPELSRHGFVSTLYLASHHMQTGTQVFDVTVDYILWRSPLKTLEVGSIGPVDTRGVRLDQQESRMRLSGSLTEYAHGLDDPEERQRLLAAVCDAAQVDHDDLVSRRIGYYMRPDQAKALRRQGMDVQLHTHRHRSPSDRAGFFAEIRDNREALSGIAGCPLVHHCYPSGNYEPQHLPWLRELGVESATTTEPGFNIKGADPLRLRRYLDWEDHALIEFEAEMCGLLELIRRTGYRI